MRRFLVMLALACAASSAEAQAPRVELRGQVLRLEAPAPSLRGNRLETPTEQRVDVYLPRDYERSALRYPAIYLLHGHTGQPGDWFDPAAVDALIARREIPPIIVVMPSGGNVYGGGFYRNSSVSGRWGDYIADDLVRFIDGRFRTLARPGARAVVGFSMGGYGAIHMAMERPDVFSVAYAQSPCCLAPVEELGLGSEAWARISTMGAAEARGLIGRGEYIAAGVLGLLTALRPEPNSAPLRVALPFRVVDGRRVPDGAAFDAYVAQFPVSRVARSRDALISLRGLALDYGVADENAHIPVGAAEFSRRLSDARIPHRLDVFTGGHLDRTSERLHTIAIPFAASRIDPPE